MRGLQPKSEQGGDEKGTDRHGRAREAESSMGKANTFTTCPDGDPGARVCSGAGVLGVPTEDKGQPRGGGRGCATGLLLSAESFPPGSETQRPA